MAAKKAVLSRVVPGKSAVMVQPAGRADNPSILSNRHGAAKVVGHGPAAHRYRAGETVTLAPNRYGSNRHGRFEVTRLLPEEHGINQYRLKSVVDGHERVAREDELL